MTKIGDLCEVEGESTFEWNINDFHLLSKETNAVYESSKFYFSGSSWDLSFYPNGETHNKSEGWVGLYLYRESSGSPITLDYTFSIKSANGKKISSVRGINVFDRNGDGWGRSKFISTKELRDKISEFAPSGILTIICTLKNSEPNSVDGSLFSRQQEICDNLKEIKTSARRSDVILKLDGCKIPVHQVIVETRSSLFNPMFRYSKKGNRKAKLWIRGVDKSTMELILEFLYTGDIENFKPEKALCVYAAALKYDIHYLKHICSEFFMKNLSEESVCYVIKFAKLYCKKELGARAREYFKENARSIIDTKEWKSFSKNNPELSVELLGSVVKSLLPEK